MLVIVECTEWNIIYVEKLFKKYLLFLKIFDASVTKIIKLL